MKFTNVARRATRLGTAVRATVNTLLAYGILFVASVIGIAVAQAQGPDPMAPGPIATASYFFVWLAFLAPVVLGVLVVLDLALRSRPSRWRVVAVGLLPAGVWLPTHLDTQSGMVEAFWLALAGVAWGLVALVPPGTEEP